VTEWTEWTMTRRQLRQWLGPVLPHAGGPKDLPSLRTVHLRSLGARTVVALATDRYTMAVHQHVSDEDMGGPVEVSVPASALGAALRVLTGDPKAPVTVGADPSGLHLSSLGTMVQVQAADVDPDVATAMPKLAAKVLAGLADAQPIVNVTVDPQLLAKWRHLLSKRITIHAGARSDVPGRTPPLLIRCGERFIGLQMPCYDKESWSPDGWLALLGPYSKKEAA